MKRAFGLFVLTALLLVGCTKAAPKGFTVSDVVEPQAKRPYGISVCLPEGMVEAVSDAEAPGRLYEAPDGSYFVVTQILQNCTAEDAIRQMTGSDARALGALCTKKGSLPEYRFSWCMEGETGMLACTGIVLEDAGTCYCAQFCADEARAKDCAHAREQVLASFGLYGNEGF